MANITLLHLYPQTLKLNGEVGNVTALKVRAGLYGHELKVSHVEVGQALPKKRPNIVFIGSGTLAGTKLAQADLVSKEFELHQWIAAGTKVVAVGSGFDLISQELILESGEALRGLGLTNTTHNITGRHLVGEVTLTNGLAGFVNSDRKIVRGSNDFVLGKVTRSDEAGLVDFLDGYFDGKVLGSVVQGPLLPMNPALADKILASVAKLPAKTAAVKKLDSLASKARDAISGRVGR